MYRDSGACLKKFPMDFRAEHHQEQQSLAAGSARRRRARKLGGGSHSPLSCNYHPPPPLIRSCCPYICKKVRTRCGRPPHKWWFLVGCSSPFSPNTSPRRFAFGAHDVCLTGEHPTCSFLAWEGCEGLRFSDFAAMHEMSTLSPPPRGSFL